MRTVVRRGLAACATLAAVVVAVTLVPMNFPVSGMCNALSGPKVSN